MDDHRLPKRLFYGELSAGKRSVGGQHKHYKDTQKTTVKNFRVDSNNWGQAALDRPIWRSLIHKIETKHKSNRTADVEKKRELRKQSLNSDLNCTDPKFIAQPVAYILKPKLAWSTTLAPTDDELSDAMVIIHLDGRVFVYCSSRVDSTGIGN